MTVELRQVHETRARVQYRRRACLEYLLSCSEFIFTRYDSIIFPRLNESCGLLCARWEAICVITVWSCKVVHLDAVRTVYEHYVLFMFYSVPLI